MVMCSIMDGEITAFIAVTGNKSQFNDFLFQ